VLDLNWVFACAHLGVSAMWVFAVRYLAFSLHNKIQFYFLFPFQLCC